MSSSANTFVPPTLSGPPTDYIHAFNTNSERPAPEPTHPTVSADLSEDEVASSSSSSKFFVPTLPPVPEEYDHLSDDKESPLANALRGVEPSSSSSTIENLLDEKNFAPLPVELTSIPSTLEHSAQLTRIMATISTPLNSSDDPLSIPLSASFFATTQSPLLSSAATSSAMQPPSLSAVSSSSATQPPSLSAVSSATFSFSTNDAGAIIASTPGGSTILCAGTPAPQAATDTFIGTPAVGLPLTSPTTLSTVVPQNTPNSSASFLSHPPSPASYPVLPGATTALAQNTTTHVAHFRQALPPVISPSYGDTSVASHTAAKRRKTEHSNANDEKFSGYSSSDIYEALKELSAEYDFGIAFKKLVPANPLAFVATKLSQKLNSSTATSTSSAASNRNNLFNDASSLAARVTSAAANATAAAASSSTAATSLRKRKA